MLIFSLSSVALAATGLAFDPAAEPVVLGEAPELGRGAVRLRFLTPRPFEAASLPAIVLALHRDKPPPEELRAVGEPLGRSERTWRVPVRGDESVLEVARRWAADPAVASVVPDLVLAHEPRSFDDPRYTSQWYLERLAMEPLYELSLGDAAIRVAVIDSGISMTHPDLAGAFVEPYDAFDDDDDPSPNPGEYCSGSDDAICDEHGTAVSGIIGARANNAEGIVGMCPTCTLVPIKMLGDGMGAVSADVAAFEHAIDADAAVINNSWGFVEPTPVPEPLADAIERAATETRGGLGSVVIFAAGNDDRELGDDEMEALATVLCVSATDAYGNPTAYTNYGDPVDVAAPSATFTTHVDGDYFETFGGTSAAAPVVSGLAGWILSVDPSLSAAEVRALVVETAVPSPKVTHDETGHNDYYGYGELNPAGILDSLTPSDTDAVPPIGCGCATTTPPAWSAVVAAGWLGRRRKRS